MYDRRRNVFLPRYHGHVGRKVLLVFLLLVLICGVYTLFDNTRVTIKTQQVLVASLPKRLEGFTVLHISDLNGQRFGEGQHRFARALRGERYDAVCITGDMVGEKGDIYPFYELLTVLGTSKPVYFIAGDADPFAIGGAHSTHASVLAEWVLGAQTRGAVFLGAPASLAVGEDKVWFTDASQLALDLDTAEMAYAGAGTPVGTYNLDVIQKTKAARAAMQPEDLHITLTHQPLSNELAQSATRAGSDSFARTVDIILAGGTVGGQWRLPFVGGLWADRWFPSEDMVQGYHYTGGLLQYISNGLSVSADSPLPGFRLFNSPSVSLLSFTAEMGDDVLPERSY